VVLSVEMRLSGTNLAYEQSNVVGKAMSFWILPQRRLGVWEFVKSERPDKKNAGLACWDVFCPVTVACQMLCVLARKKPPRFDTSIGINIPTPARRERLPLRPCKMALKIPCFCIIGASTLANER